MLVRKLEPKDTVFRGCRGNAIVGKELLLVRHLGLHLFGGNCNFHLEPCSANLFAQLENGGHGGVKRVFLGFLSEKLQRELGLRCFAGANQPNDPLVGERRIDDEGGVHWLLEERENVLNVMHGGWFWLVWGVCFNSFGCLFQSLPCCQ